MFRPSTDSITRNDSPMTYSLHALSVSAGRLGLAVLLACSSISAQSLTPSHPGFKAPVPTRQFMTPEQADILSHMSVVYLDDGQGGTVKTIRIDGANLQVVNGQGTTNTTNGLGNLIVGYNELGNFNGDDRTGSHNLVTGQANSFSSYGGLVAGQSNTVSGRWSSVSGGKDNTASGLPLLGQRRVRQYGQRHLLFGQRRGQQHGQRLLLLGQRRAEKHGQRQILLGQRRVSKHAQRQLVLGQRRTIQHGPRPVFLGQRRARQHGLRQQLLGQWRGQQRGDGAHLLGQRPG